MRISILSPHRDDAAFSCGLLLYALLRAGAEVTIVNVFTISDYAIDARTLDAALPVVESVTLARRLEDERFAADLAASSGREEASVQLVDLRQRDAPLRLQVRTEQVLESPLEDAAMQAEAEAIAELLAPLPASDCVFAPLALGDHIDHRIVREAAKLSLRLNRIALYEDLPYAARLSSRERNSAAIRATAWKQPEKMQRYALHVANGPHLKHRFAMHYTSQIAPEVATEMAEDAARCGSGGSGAEQWWALPVLAASLAEFLQGGPAPRSVVQEQQ